MRIFSMAMLLVLCSAGLAVGAEQWSRFRGPDGAGRGSARSAPVSWTEKDYNWKTELPGTGHGSPVLWDASIYLTCADANTGARTVLCLKAADGEISWRRDFPSAKHKQHRENHFASSTPAVDEAGVVVTWATPKQVTLLALDRQGRDMWRRELGPFESMHGSGSSPIVFGDVVVLANDQQGQAFLIAVDRQTGETRWRVERRGGLTPASTPAVFRPKGGPPELIFTSMAHGLTSVDPASGRVNWERDDVFLDRCVGSAVCTDGLVVASFGFGSRGARLVAVRPGSKAKEIATQVVWDIKEAVPLVPTSLIVGDLLFLWGDDGRVTCVEAATGKQFWRERLESQFYGSPVCVNNRLYCISKKGEVFVIAAARKFQLLARSPLGERSYATPAVGNGVLYLRTYSQLMSVGGGKSKQ